MSNVEFDEQNTESNITQSRMLYSRIEPSDKVPKIVTWMVHHHIVKTPKQADYIIVVLVVLSILASIGIVLWAQYGSFLPRSYEVDVPDTNTETQIIKQPNETV